MGLFRKKTNPVTVSDEFPSDRYEAVLRSSICTGETTACFRNRETGKITEIMFIRNAQDLEQFGVRYGVDVKNLPKFY